MIAPFLAERGAAELIQDPEFLWLVGALVVTLLFGAFLLSRIERWRKRQLSDSPVVSEVEQFSNYRAMYENGELTKEEFERIRAKEALRVRNKLIPKTQTVAPATNEPPAQPSPKEPESPPPQP
jgi:hypothetical protein